MMSKGLGKSAPSKAKAPMGSGAASRSQGKLTFFLTMAYV